MQKLKESGKKGEEPVSYSPGSPKEHNDIANTLIEAGKYEEAIAEIYWSLDLDPKNLYLNFKLGTIFEQIGWYEDAFWQYEQVLGKFPDMEEVIERYNTTKFRLEK